MSLTRNDVLGKLADIMGTDWTQKTFINLDPVTFACDAYAEPLIGHETMLNDEEAGLVCDMSDHELHAAVLSRLPL